MFVLIRTRDAGIHCGDLCDKNLNEGWVRLDNARRIWRWRGANTLHELALNGAEEDYTRISEPLDGIYILGVCEIIPCSEVAVENLTRSRWGS